MIPRPITERELSVIRASLKIAGKMQFEPSVLDRLDTLLVIRRGDCGCDSVDFADDDAQRPSRPIADGTGKTAAGGDVGIIIWGTDDAVTAIEVYDLGARDRDIRLPVESSIRPW